MASITVVPPYSVPRVHYVDTYESVSADGAGELLLSGVRAAVAGELVGAAEAPVAAGHGAAVRTLAYAKSKGWSVNDCCGYVYEPQQYR